MTHNDSTDEFLTRVDYERAAEFISRHTQHKPKIGVILGSGLNTLADEITQADVIPYREIPGFPGFDSPGTCG